MNTIQEPAAVAVAVAQHPAGTSQVLPCCLSIYAYCLCMYACQLSDANSQKPPKQSASGSQEVSTVVYQHSQHSQDTTPSSIGAGRGPQGPVESSPDELHIQSWHAGRCGTRRHAPSLLHCQCARFGGLLVRWEYRCRDELKGGDRQAWRPPWHLRGQPDADSEAAQGAAQGLSAPSC